MSDKLSIVYVGKKAKKKDTITGSRLIFKRGEATPVDVDIARRLLEYPKVWVEESEAKDVIEKSLSDEKSAQEQADILAKEQAKQAQQESFLAKDGAGDTLDLAKCTGPQLVTLVEAEGITVEAKQSPVSDYRIAVRDALREKNGIPELEEQE